MTRVSRGVLAVALAGALVGGSPSSGWIPPSEQLAGAVRASARGDLRAALFALRPLALEPGLLGGRASYLLGRVALRLRRFSEAYRDFGRAAEFLPVLADHARYYQAVAAFDQGHFTEAAALFEAAAREFPGSTLRAEALFWRAESLWGARSAEAPAAFRRYLDEEGSGVNAPRAWFDMGQALEQQGRWAEAAQAYRRVRWAYPGSTYEELARARLAALAARSPLPPDDTPPEVFYQRALAELGAGQPAAARVDLFRVLALAPRAPVADDARFRLGVLAYEAGRAEVAEEFFRRVVADGHSRGDDALFYLERIALARGREAAALEDARQLARRYPQSSLAPRAFYAIGESLADRGALAAALPFFAMAAERFPHSRGGERAAWARGWVLFRLGRWGEARSAWLLLAGRDPEPEIGAASLYWAARAEILQGRRDRAEREYRQAALRYPETYYGQRAAAQAGLPLRLAVGPPPGDVPAGTIAYFDRYRELEGLGEAADATRELAAAAGASSPEDRVPIVALLGRQYLAQGQVSRGVGQAEEVAQELVRAGRPLPLALWELLYPRADWTEVTRASSRTGVDPYLLAAIIREESRFDPQALSGAGAYGLMQLMPETARTVAGSLGLLPPDRSALADPGTNVLLGAAVLKAELARFGRIDLALAAYNAGPGAVRRWLRERGAPDQDNFIESVPYPETRAYVKAVLRSWGIYRWLYREGHPSP